LEEVKNRNEDDDSTGTGLVSWVCGRAILRLSILLPMVWILCLAVLDNGSQGVTKVVSTSRSPILFSVFQTFCDCQIVVLVAPWHHAKSSASSSVVEHVRLNVAAAFRIRLIGQTRTVAVSGQDMCECQPPAYDPYAYPALPAPTPLPLWPVPVSYLAVPYPSLTVSYDPYWPTRVTPTTRPVELAPVKGGRFRGEFMAGNWLLIYE